MMNNTGAVDFINKLEGYKTALNGCHWETTGNSEHIYSDSFNKELGEFQDGLVEDLSFTYGRIDKTQIFPTTFIFENFEILIRSMLQDTIFFRQEVAEQNSPYDFGVLSFIDDFIHRINQSGYRSQLI